ncbi:C39 family peptidase [Tuberibacillus calidus]|uniref:C39 family peptidase n=1 Tax=Tuberibacillus calidus TaxID=340097 RepID=UPI00040A0F11|nr:C39 family peptidase [Tuberibacillus calidus]
MAQKQIILDVPLIAQLPELPRGCEVTSLAMLLHFAGHHVDKMELAERIRKVPFEKDGLRGNLYDGFVGDMYSFETDGLGVYDAPIADLAREFLGERVIVLTGSDWSAVEKQLDNGFPVWVIVNEEFRPLPDSDWQTWPTARGPLKVTYKEHAVVITGYDDDFVYFNDPLAPKKNRKEPKSDFLAAWKQFGNQAISYT